MTELRRARGGRSNGTDAPKTTGRIGRACPVCGAAPGWRCKRAVGDQMLPMKRFHPQRSLPREET